MRKGNRIVLILAAMMLLVVVAWLALSAREPEPIYDGKPLDVWLLGYRSVEPEKRMKAVEMTRRVGTNALPTVIRMLNASDPPIKRHVMGFVQEQSSYRVQYISSRIRNCAAVDACAELGEKAKPAVPALVQLLKSDDKVVRGAASAALKDVDGEAADRAGIE